MNANELADALVEMKGYYGYNEEAATMLRQQQAEIANLKAGLLSHHDIYPVKALTDEEIREVYGKDWEYQDGDYMRFARALLRKAQEK